ncbi:MAG: type II toxin-antitoxin system RelE/ParE family toxin [Candidatus Nealsonbacteria bacterium]|nr:type II toxin-antitoxin system RelE/ParE family toxin [Candidatus Nealsonbacteria bacterium]
MSSEINWKIEVRERIYKDIEKFPQNDKMRILQFFEAISLNPFSGDIEKMKGEENVWRRRVGAYRIFYEILSEDRVIYIFRVERRTSKTY